jgi:charged multivesicular body protein 2A
MGNVFGSEKPLKEIIRENQRMLKKAMRELEREIGNLRKNETKLVNDIKKMAKEGQMVRL